MTLYEFEGRRPEVHETSYVSESAEVIGDVTIGKGCFIAPGVVIKGDYGTVKIGDNSNVQENCVVHARPDETTTIGRWVTVGHAAVIHGATINDYAVIGMGAIVSDDAAINEWGVVAEGAVVNSGKVVEKETVVAGVPAKPIKKIDDKYKETWMEIKKEYSSFSKRYKENLKRL
ncbi:MAG: gamma carbonic anhydrase family protein [Candidatus Saliniplasma sp.]